MTTKFTRDEIASRLDITDPFLMIDDFEVIEPGRLARATKELTKEDWFFDCHLPKSQVMPATLQTEGMLQSLVLLIYAAENHGEHRSFVTNISVNLISAAEPGQKIIYEARLKSFRRGIAKGEVTSTADGKTLCKGEFSYASPHLMTLPTAQGN
jgi:3-hydroxyacyl-[acyl-carrier-protein] dehydratase